jgi:hypothetical protein
VTGVAIDRVQLRRISATLGYADVRLDAVHLCGIKVERRPDGHLSIRPPEHVDRLGRTWPAFALQPGAREAVEEAISRLWDRATA